MLNSVKDCIHGFIDLPFLCKKYFYTNEVQRMGCTHQLGVTRKVFPCANHTRLEHSLGVMHLAGVLGSRLGIEERELNLIQLAGLMHDVGHYPYSHLFDTCLHQWSETDPEYTQRKLLDVPIKHEDRSVKIFRKLSLELNLLSDKEVNFVVDCIKGNIGDTYPKYYYQIINSNIDVDKFDYLQRDAYHTGVTMFQPEYIIRCAVVDDTNNLSFLIKSRNDIEQMFKTREIMHLCVYQNQKCIQYDNAYYEMILRCKEKISFEDLWENDIESLLRNSPETRDDYSKLLQGTFEYKSVLTYQSPSALSINDVKLV